MYSELFKLKEPPFRLTPDPDFLFASKQHSRAKAYMESTIWLADGFVVITGEIGAGKTTLIESFLNELPPGVILAHVNQTQLTPIEFLQAVLVEFGFHEFHDRKVELLAKLKEFMIEQYTQGKTLLLIVDEAQNLSHKVLEELRLLSGIESQKEKPLRIILAGQPELADKLDSLRLEQLRQRIRLRFHLSTLSKRETGEYIQHRLDVAGAQGRKIFDKDAVDLIFRYAGGVPRLINVLCDTAMLCGFSEEKDKIDVGLVSEAVQELQWVEYDKRNENRGRFSASHAKAAPRIRLFERDTDNDVEEPAATTDSADERGESDQRAGDESILETEEPAVHVETSADLEVDVDTTSVPRQDSDDSESEAPTSGYWAQFQDESLARFDVLFKDQHITEFNLSPGCSVVGRTGDNDLQIRSRFISRHHLQITSDELQSVVEDLKSTNGTFINSSHVQRHVLEDGDVIQLGEHKLVYRDLRHENSRNAVRPAPQFAEFGGPADDDGADDSPPPGEFAGISTEVYESKKTN